jgi:2-dehydro-3-deoxygluconokinase
MKDIDILSIGEPLAEFAEVTRDGETLLAPGYGGDAMNTAVAAARQGARTAVFTALGDDPFGKRFLDLWDREGVDRSGVIVRKDAPTGIYFVTYGPDGHAFTYYRKGSAASLMTAAELPQDLVARSRIVHFSAVSQAISASASAACLAAAKQARESGALLSYDTNLRLKLWPLEKARETTLKAAALADILRPSIDDARHLLGIDDQDAIVRTFLEMGARLVVLTLGPDGALLATREKTEFVPGQHAKALDATGAGDCFTGAFLAEYLRSGDAARATRYGNVAAALKTLGRGAVGPIPRRAEVERLL